MFWDAAKWSAPHKRGWKHEVQQNTFCEQVAIVMLPCNRFALKWTINLIIIVSSGTQDRFRRTGRLNQLPHKYIFLKQTYVMLTLYRWQVAWGKCVKRKETRRNPFYIIWLRNAPSETSGVMQLVGEKVKARSKSQGYFRLTTAASWDAQGQEITKSGKG